MLGSVGTSPFDSPFQFIFLGLYFAGRARTEVAFFLSPARARFPAPRRAWVPPLAGSGAGCTRVAVHAVGVHRFPAPTSAACAPPPHVLAPVPSVDLHTTAKADTCTVTRGVGCGVRVSQRLNNVRAGKESGGLEGRQEPTPSCSTSYVTSGNLLIRALCTTFFCETGQLPDDFLGLTLQIFLRICGAHIMRTVL